MVILIFYMKKYWYLGVKWEIFSKFWKRCVIFYINDFSKVVCYMFNIIMIFWLILSCNGIIYILINIDLVIVLRVF